MTFNEKFLPAEVEKSMLGIDLLDHPALESFPQSEEGIFSQGGLPRRTKEGWGKDLDLVQRGERLPLLNWW